MKSPWHLAPVHLMLSRKVVMDRTVHMDTARAKQANNIAQNTIANNTH